MDLSTVQNTITAHTAHTSPHLPFSFAYLNANSATRKLAVRVMTCVWKGRERHSGFDAYRTHACMSVCIQCCTLQPPITRQQRQPGLLVSLLSRSFDSDTSIRTPTFKASTTPGTTSCSSPLYSPSVFSRTVTKSTLS